jgi:hypothetical protein
MSLSRLLQSSTLTKEETRCITAAFELTLYMLCIQDRDGDPLTESIAKKVIKIAQSGVQNPAEISALTIKELGAVH